jgi:hypothetical protein
LLRAFLLYDTLFLFSHAPGFQNNPTAGLRQKDEKTVANAPFLGVAQHKVFICILFVSRVYKFN